MEKIPEHFLHYVWRFRLFNENNLKTSDGQQISIEETGSHNTDAGPDFYNARIYFGNTLWAGDVEIHVLASDWIRHGHQDDGAYNSVILHVVAFNDCQVTRTNGDPVPTLQLSFDRKLLEKYTDLTSNTRWISCEKDLPGIPSLYMTQWITSLGIERIMQRVEHYRIKLDKSGNDWDHLLHHMLANCFGLPLNTLPFDMLAEALPVSTLLRLRKDRFSLEALIFGKAGFLDQVLPEDQYMISLFKEYDRLRDRHHGEPVPLHMWKFLRLRPAAFPTVRLAQFASLIHEHYPLTEKLSSCLSIENIENLFTTRAGDYWNTHFVFGKISGFRSKYTGTGFINLLIINAIAPFQYIYGKAHGNEQLSRSALHLLESLPAEENRIIKKWTTFGIRATSAFDSQALLQLYNMYCSRKKCHNCQVGIKLISRLKDEGT